MRLIANYSSCLAAALGHTVAFPGYISDAGAKAPEAALFTFCLNLVAVLFIMTVYVRYKQVEKYCVELGLERTVAKVSLKRNKQALWFAWIAALGLMVLANFRYSASLRSVCDHACCSQIE